MVHRTTNRQTPQTLTQTLTYDAENRLIQRHDDGNQYAPVATYAYDGDGRRVRATINGVTTLYVGGHTEFRMEAGTPSTQTLVSYYYAGIQRVAMREKIIGGTNTLYYLLSDHLGSTSATLDTDGYKIADLRYNAWGVERWTTGTTPTARRYTGQIDDDGTGLYFYGARYYDPVLSRFTQADSIVPSGTPQTLNRYAYVQNNPVRYTDPTGHADEESGACTTDWCWQNRWYNAQGYQWNGKTWSRTGVVKFSDYAIAQEFFAQVGIGFDNLMDWDLKHLSWVGQGVADFAKAVGGMNRLNKLLNPSGALPLTFKRTNVIYKGCEGSLACAISGGSARRVEFYDDLFKEGRNGVKFSTVHELAHHLDLLSNKTIRTEFKTESVESGALQSFRRRDASQQPNEYWADAVALYVYPVPNWSDRRGPLTVDQVAYIRQVLGLE